MGFPSAAQAVHHPQKLHTINKSGFSYRAAAAAATEIQTAARFCLLPSSSLPLALLCLFFVTGYMRSISTRQQQDVPPTAGNRPSVAGVHR
ncbi:hypothetical protein LZ31DRAFT_140504 [Colletotrichum somersetense]|nr:hypothetical protein LZ31DRAFT_140504 [Colletotrichum somersetense]